MHHCFSPAEILLPDFKKTNACLWATVACDQFTSEASYWEKAAKLTEGVPSTLNLILPEVYLNEAEKRIPGIHNAMKQYRKEVLRSYPDTMIYTERTQSDGSIRQGLVLAIDLECYDYRKGAESLIRATEATVVERIPPRMAVRRQAELELPHIMLLIDDPGKTVIEPLAGQSGEIVYNTDLMLGGGHITGRILRAEEKDRITAALDALITPEAMEARYGHSSLAPLLFAVGDGNHSLASAKAVYEELKVSLGEAAKNHPARYALAEVVNIHSESLKFEPIYRVAFHVDVKDLLLALTDYAKRQNGNAPAQYIEYLSAGIPGGVLQIERPCRQLTVGSLQDFLDEYGKSHPEMCVDYIHGKESAIALASQENTVAFLFTGMEKNQLFKTVIFDGALPRKTFSMGHAEDKRYYLECRCIAGK